MPPGMRLGIGIAGSLLVHGLILSLQFGVLGLGVPGLDLPWSERRAQPAPLTVRLTDVKRAPEIPPVMVQAEPTPAGQEAPAPVAGSAPDPTRMQVHVAPPSLEAAKPAAPAKKARRKPKRSPRIVRSKPDRPKAPEVIALNESKPDTFVLPAPAPDEVPPPEILEEVPTPPADMPATASTSEDLAAQRDQELDMQRGEEEKARAEAEAKHLEEEAAKLAQEEAARAVRSAAQEEARRVEDARRQALELEAKWRAEEAALIEEARQQEEARARQQAMELEARRKAEEAALALRRQEEQRAAQEAARRAELEAKRLEEEKAKREAAELAARRQAEEAAHLQAEAQAHRKQAEEAEMRRQAEAAAAQRREQERLAAEEAARHAAAARAAESSKAATAGLSRNPSGSDLASRALDQARRPEPLRVEPRAPAPPVASMTAEAPQRRSIFGSGKVDVNVMMYIESWRLKIERNGRLNYSQSSTEKARGDPVVTVSIRSDGSVEDVVINRSSGRPELDAAVRRIVRLNERYGAFPPNLARQYDVIEIRRVWNFDEVLRILEEMR
ncbi:MAG TPA: TonB family protein [Noviherbaspirillum sp.]|uniref:TonB family protein n=1 Tax=Noviherbaspirillum sp. TaxID=1926288 RepID=UPI002B48BF25|nr:TonB family protein [Noviherbaspirillum sp.]HJV86498.1 TonB family protein [Noviherbaspirillum sp.]